MRINGIITKSKTWIKRRWRVLIILFIILILSSITLILLNNVENLEIKYYSIDAGLRARIVLLSDLHFGSYNGYWRRVVDETVGLSPDIIIIAGDAVNGREGVDGLREFLSSIRNRLPKTPIIAVAGNWEYATNSLGEVLDAYHEYNIIYLQNNYTLIKTSSGKILVIGLDDALFGRPDYGLAYNIRGVNASLRILVVHEPLPAYNILKGNYSGLILSGHCHGGQIRLFGRPIYLPQGCSTDIYTGIHSYGNTTLIISNGLGTTTLPIRIGARPEIVVIDTR